MPWTGKTFHKHNKKLTDAQSAKAAKQATAVLKSGVPEGEAIAIANKQAAKSSMSKKMYKTPHNG